MKTVFLIILSLLICQVSVAESCPWGDGGYCVDTLARETLKVVKEAVDPTTESVRQETSVKLSLPEAQAAPDALSGGIPYYNFYEALWSLGILADKKATFDEAAAAGGTKIGGVNLVVLGARTLQRMAKFISSADKRQMSGNKRLASGKISGRATPRRNKLLFQPLPA